MSANNQNKDQTYHYFTYGKVPAEREAPKPSSSLEESPAANALPEVEVTPPREVKMYPAWTYSGPKQESRRSGFRTVALSFLAGAVLVGGLMFASDKYNLFTEADNLPAGVSSGSNIAQAASGGGSTVTTAANEVVRPNTIAELVEVASPAVVKIETYATQRSRSSGQYQDFFDYFFGIPSQPSQPESKQGQLVQVGSGSGFFFDKEGYILTNEHVVNGAEQVKVVVEGEKEPYVAEVLGTAYNLDLAVLKIEGKGDFPTLPLGDSSKAKVGDWVVAIGNPYEFDHTVTVGVVSAKERAIDIQDTEGTRQYQALLQTDASINPGNSGGPLLNLNGEVIGINTAVNAQAQGIGFAIPTSTINDVLETLKANKQVPIPYIGVVMGDVPEEYIDDLGLKNGDGAFISDVIFRSPAHKGGLQKYDVIVGIDGKAMKSADDVKKAINGKKPGDKITVNVIRNGKEITLDVTIGDRNEQEQ